MADLTVKQKQIFDNYKKTHPKMSDAEILSALVNLGQIQLSEEQKLSLFNNSTNNDSGMGLKLEHTQKSANPTNQAETVFLQSGRKIVITKTQDGKDVYKYYATDGTQLKPDYFKKQEGVVRVSANRKTYTVTKNGNTTVKEAKDPLMAKIDQQQSRLNKTKNEQGFLGKSWDWFKNTTGIGDSSNKAQKQLDAERKLVQQIQNGKISKKDFKDVTGLDYSQENLQKFKSGELGLKSTEKIKGYQEGQEMACDMIADMTAGMVAFGIYTAAVAAAPFTGGASIAVGVVAATATGSLLKTGLKYADAKSGGREYKGKEFGKDMLTGGLSGVLAPVTAGFGGAVGKTVATKFGVQAVTQVGKQVTKEVGMELAEQGGKEVLKGGFKQTFKTLLTKPTALTFEGGSRKGRILAWGAEALTAGAVWGGVDGGARTTYDQVESGEGIDVGQIAMSTVEGTVGGAVAGLGFGGAMKGVGKFWGKLFGKGKPKAEGAKTEVKTSVTKEASLTEGKQLAESAAENVKQTLSKEYKSAIEKDIRLSDEVKAVLLQETDVNLMQKRMELCETLKYEFRISDERYNALIKDLPIETIEEKLKLYELVKKDSQFEDYIERVFADKNCRTLEDLKAIKKADIELKLKQEEEIKQAELLKQKQELERQAKVQASYEKIEQTFGKTKEEVLDKCAHYGISDTEKMVTIISECIDKAKSLGKKADFERFYEIASLQKENSYKINFLQIEALFDENPNITKFINTFRRSAQMMMDDHSVVLENKLKLFKQILECKELPILVNDKIWNTGATKNIFSYLGKDSVDLRLNLLKLACKESKYTDFILNCIDKVNSEEMYNVVDKMLKIKSLLKDEYSMLRISEVFNTKDFNAEKVNLFLDYVLKNKEFAESEMLMQNASAILHTIASQNEYLPILEKIIHNKDIYNNKTIINYFNGLISSVYYQLDQKVLAKNKLTMLDYLLEEPKLLKNKELLDTYMHSIEYAGEEVAEINAKIHYLKQIFNNKYDESKYADKFFHSFSSIETMEDTQNFLSAIKIISTDKFSDELVEKIMVFSNHKDVLEFIKFVAENEKLMNDKVFIDDYFGDIIGNLAVKSGLNFESLMKIINTPELCTKDNLILCKNIGRGKYIAQDEAVQNAIFKWIENKKISRNLIIELAKNLDENSIKFVDKYIDNPNFEPKTALQDILGIFSSYLKMGNDSTYREIAEILCEHQTFPKNLIADIIKYSHQGNKELILKLANDKNFAKENIPRLSYLTQNSTNVIYSLEDLNNRIALIEKLAFDKELGFPQNGIASFVESRLVEDISDPKLLNAKYMKCFKEIASKDGTVIDMTLADAFFDFYGKSRYQELSRTQKREFLYKLLEQKNNISSEENTGILSLIPQNEQEYADIIKIITNDLNMNLKPLSSGEIDLFTNELNRLATVGSSNIERIQIKEICKNIAKYIPEIFAEGKANISDDLVLIIEKVIKNKSFEKLSDKDKQILLLSTLLQVKRNNYTATDKAFNAYYIAKKFNLSNDEANRIYSIVESSDLIQQFMATTKNKTVIGGFRRGQTIEGIEREDLFDLAAFRLQNNNDFELARMLYSASEPEGLTRHFDKLLQHRIREIKATNFIMPQTAKSVYEAKAKPMTIWRDGKQYTVYVVKRSEIENFFAFMHTPEAGFASGGGRTANLANFDILANIKNNKVISTNYISNDFVNLVADHGFVLIPKNNSQHVISGFDIYSLGKNVPSMLIEYYRDRGVYNAYGKLRYSERVKASNALKEILHPEYTKLVQELNSAIDLINKRYDSIIDNAEKALKKKIQQLTGKENPNYEEYKAIIDNPELKELKNAIADLKQKKNTALETIPSRRKVEQIDDDYINRLDKILEMFGDEPMSLDKLAQFDEEMARAYKTLLARDAKDPRLSEKALLKTDNLHHNEAIVSDVEVGPIYTTDLNTIPIEYLEFAQTKPTTFLLVNQ